MPLALEQFVKNLEDSGILAGDTIKDFVPPNASPKDAEELARELIRQKKLTKFQAEELYRGKGKSLVLGNYLLLEKIGAGGMGQVFKARHRRMDRLVAVKLLPPAMTKDKAAIARFEREVKAAAKLRHPNIVAADDADCANGVHFLVMEHVEGSDLSALVKKNGPFPENQAVNYILQAARGLEFAHAEGVIHRDIKPANLLLDKKGIVKILDMGLARIETHGDVGTQAELTGTGMVMGTVDYMAPEQAMSTKNADARADIYSLGCSLFYLLTGKATFDGETITAKLIAHQSHPIPELRKLCAAVSPELDAVFNKMMAKKITDRYQTMTQVISDLERLGAVQQGTATFQQGGGVQSSTSQTLENSELNLFKNIQITQTIPVIKVKKSVVAPSKNTQPPWKNPKVLIGAAVLGILLLAGIVVSLQTKDGKLIVEVDQADAMVQVLDIEGKVEVSQKGGGKITISVDPGKHRLKIVKDGFSVYGKDFEIESGGKKTITAKLVPVEDKPAVADAVAGNKPWDSPGFKKWMKGVQAMSAEKQVEAVSKKLMELNPGFDGKMDGHNVGSGTPKFENGVVTEMQFLTDKVTVISPVRVLSGLKSLYCYGSDYNGILTDISPLQGMQLTKLNLIGNRKLTDISPLKGMPLTWLRLAASDQLFDLSPLKGMPLTELGVRATEVFDLSPLRGMKLTYLDIFQSNVSDLSVIKGMQLSTLSISNSKISDLTPLRGMPLKFLEMGGTSVTDLSPLAGMPITELVIVNSKISDLTPLMGTPLKNLVCNFNPERDTELLRSIKTLETINGKPAADFWKEVEAQQKGKKLGFQMPGFDQWMKDVAALPAEKQVEAVSKKLVELNPGFDGKVLHMIRENVVTDFVFLTDNVTDMSPVRALVGLTILNCAGSGIGIGKLSDLSPLQGMPLTYLNCAWTQVSDLSPLEGMKLAWLECHGTQVSVLSPLKAMPLTHLDCSDAQVADLSPLKAMPLTSLSCASTQVSDVSPLKGMKLMSLNLFRTKVSDFSPLQDCKSLKSLNVVAIKVTPERIAALQKDLPNCKIEWDDPAKPRTP